MKKPWFAVNRFWGFYPTSFEGFLVISSMVASLIFIILLSDLGSNSIADTLIQAFPLASLSVTLTILVALLTSNKPAFGEENKKSKNYSPDQPAAYLFLALLVLPVIFYYLIFGGYKGAFILTLVFVILFLVYRYLKILE